MRISNPLKVKEVTIQDRRYILNTRQARKDATDREAIVESRNEELKTNPKSLIGTQGFRTYLTFDREQIPINHKQIDEESRLDGKWVRVTNTHLFSRRGGFN